jgi:hypothetical protein
LSRKFERLLISEEVDLDMTFAEDNAKAQSMVGTSSSRGLGKKRTFRELERWDIESTNT